MRCPFCGAAAVLSERFCARCHVDIDYLEKRVYPGRQFVFVYAVSSQPIVLDLVASNETQPTERRFSEPSIVARHEFAVHFGPSRSKRIIGPWGRMIPTNIPEVLPQLDLHTMDLVTVITDRKIYRRQDEVHIVAIGPGCAGQEVELEVQLSGQRVYQAKAVLDSAGLHLRRYDGLDEGEYRVLLRLAQRPDVQAQCAFSCAEFTLSPLIATLESHQIDGDRLRLEVKLTQLTAPYSGPVQLKLLSGERTLLKQAAKADQGRLAAELNLTEEWWWLRQEALRIELVTPEGNTATIPLPGAGSEEREHIQLCPLDRPVEASLAPFSGQEGTARGLHYGYSRIQDTPFELLGVVAAEGRLRALRDAALLHLLVFNPMDGSHRRLEFGNVKAGDELSFAVDAPYSLFTLAAFMARGEPFEAWGVVIRPVALQARLEAPDTALPGQVMVARVEVDRPCACLLLVYDARLEHESPMPKLAKRLYTHLRNGTRDLGAQRLAPLATAQLEQFQGWEEASEMVFRSLGGPPRGNGMKSPGAGPVYSAEVMEAEAPELVLAMMLAPRESFPELAFLELFPIDHVADKTIRLGDQIGIWRCRAYLFDGLDSVELTRDIQVDTPVYAELDLPAILGKGDSVTATARYHAPKPAVLTITTPVGQFGYSVTGDGVVEFPLDAPGHVTTTIVAGDASDVSQRMVDPPGLETVTASWLMLLQQGETASGRRVVVYPSPMPALRTAIDYLITYPFG